MKTYKDYKMVTAECWQGIVSGTEVQSGYGYMLTAPDGAGVYDLYELADDQNCHAGWRWVAIKES